MTANISRRRWCAAIVGMASSASFLEASFLAAQETHSNVAIHRSAAPPVQGRVYRLIGESDQPVVVTAIAADPRGQYVAAAGDDNSIRILDPATFRTIATLPAHRDIIRTLAFNPNGDKLVSAGNDGQVIVWNRNDNFAVLQSMPGSPAIARVRFAADGSEMAAVGFNNNIYLIGKRSRSRSVLQCDCNDLRAVAYRDDNDMIAVAGRNGVLHLYDFETGNLTGEYPLHQGRIHDITFHRGSNAAVCVGEDGTVTVFDTNSKKLLQRIEVTTGKLFAVAILNSQLIAVAGSDNDIRVVNTDDGAITKTLTGHRGSVSTLAASDDVLFSGGYDATLRRWSIAEISSRQQRIAEVDASVDR